MRSRSEIRMWEIVCAGQLFFTFLLLSFSQEFDTWMIWLCVVSACIQLYGAIRIWRKGRLICVKLKGRGVNDADLARLKEKTELQELTIAFVPEITAEGWGHLRELATLQTLSIINTHGVTDAALENIQGLTELQWLELVGTEITDARLAHLQGLEKLDFLNLYGTKVTDAGLIHLEGLTNLCNLDVRHTDVTDAGVNRIRTALPKCKVSASWRPSPRSQPACESFADANSLSVQ